MNKKNAYSNFYIPSSLMTDLKHQQDLIRDLIDPLRNIRSDTQAILGTASQVLGDSALKVLGIQDAIKSLAPSLNLLTSATSIITANSYKSITNSFSALSSIKNIDFSSLNAVKELIPDISAKIDHLSKMSFASDDYIVSSDVLDLYNLESLEELVSNTLDNENSANTNNSVMTIKRLGILANGLLTVLMAFITIYSFLSAEKSSQKILENQNEIVSKIDNINLELSEYPKAIELLFEYTSDIYGVLIQIENNQDHLIELQEQEIEIEEEQLEYLKKISDKIDGPSSIDD